MLGLASSLTQGSLMTKKGAVLFDGNDSYEAADSTDFTVGYDTNHYAIAFRLNLDTFSGTQGIMMKDDEWSIYFHSGAFYFSLHDESEASFQYWGASAGHLSGDTVVTGGIVTDGSWHHFLFRTDYIGIVVDGVAITANSGTGPGWEADENTTSKLYIGKGKAFHANNTNIYMTGEIDDIVIWKLGSAMTDAQAIAYANSGDLINPLANSGNYNVSSSVVAYYKFDDLTDSSTNSHTLSISDGDPVLI